MKVKYKFEIKMKYYKMIFFHLPTHPRKNIFIRNKNIKKIIFKSFVIVIVLILIIDSWKFMFQRKFMFNIKLLIWRVSKHIRIVIRLRIRKQRTRRCQSLFTTIVKRSIIFFIILRWLLNILLNFSRLLMIRMNTLFFRRMNRIIEVRSNSIIDSTISY